MRPLVGWSACADNGPETGKWRDVNARGAKKKPTKQETTIVNCKFCTCVCVCVEYKCMKILIAVVSFCFCYSFASGSRMTGAQTKVTIWRKKEKKNSLNRGKLSSLSLSFFSPHYFFRLLLSLRMPKGSHSSRAATSFFFFLGRVIRLRVKVSSQAEPHIPVSLKIDVAQLHSCKCRCCCYLRERVFFFSSSSSSTILVFLSFTRTIQGGKTKRSFYSLVFNTPFLFLSLRLQLKFDGWSWADELPHAQRVHACGKGASHKRPRFFTFYY